MISGLSLFQETVCRARAATPEPPVVVCSVEHRSLVEDQLGHLRVTPVAIVCEPVARSTAPAVAAAALAIGDGRPGALLLVLPSDHLVGNVPQFVDDVAAATPAAAAGFLVTFGVTSTIPEAGCGCIRQGPALDGILRVCEVDEFVEELDPYREFSFVEEGWWLSNSGMVLVSRDVLLAELTLHEPSAARAAELAVKLAKRDSRALLLDLESFSSAPSISLGRAVMERTEQAAVLRCSVPWSDVGAWSWLRETSSLVIRPWGSYRAVDVGGHHQVKRIVVDPGQRLSLQRHRQRAEHWVVVQGTASVVLAEEPLVLHENDSLFVPVGWAYRLENAGTTPLHLVEVQVGDSLGEEDDNQRLADDYGRA
jgi:mannose-1-phosphate guanylyltransferase/mannose-6-phosphate isomerase-like protein (cupin superfamily)